MNLFSGGGRHTVPLDVHLIATRDGPAGPEVLLSRRAGAVYAAGLWHAVSGHVDHAYEDAVTALVRETHEETGLVVDPADVRAALTVHHRPPAGGKGPRVGFFFEVRRWEGTPRVMEPDKCDAMGWFPLDALPEPMVAYCRAGLDAYRAGARVALHFQEPDDPIAYEPGADRLHIVPAPNAAALQPEEPVRDFAERAVGRITDWTDVSWARENSRVWRVHGAAGGVWFVKVHQNDRFHARETTALRSWVPALGSAGPRLVAADPELRAAVLTAVEGRSLHGAVLAPDNEREVFRAIGELAARIHAGSLPPSGPTAARADPHAKLERHVQSARPHLEPGDEAYVRRVAKHARLLPPLEAVVTHGDLQLRNLLLAGDGTVRVIDFERSEPQPAVRDFVRLLDALGTRDDLFEAFFNGYGRPLTDVEKAHLAADAVLDAVSGIAFGSRLGDPELVERGRRTLARRNGTTLSLPHPISLSRPLPDRHEGGTSR
ncbi:phosphotransferase [Streptomyces sp. SBC-4]|nr:phosphotransferase [Streptomyces sp. SBC-4]MDV5143434.1 phosphotransferase [Streptomyces sp. SBC-4]